jgi:hypothetical protein
MIPGVGGFDEARARIEMNSPLPESVGSMWRHVPAANG